MHVQNNKSRKNEKRLERYHDKTVNVWIYLLTFFSFWNTFMPFSATHPFIYVDFSIQFVSYVHDYVLLSRVQIGVEHIRIYVLICTFFPFSFSIFATQFSIIIIVDPIWLIIIIKNSSGFLKIRPSKHFFFLVDMFFDISSVRWYTTFKIDCVFLGSIMPMNVAQI